MPGTVHGIGDSELVRHYVLVRERDNEPKNSKKGITSVRQIEEKYTAHLCAKLSLRVVLDSNTL